MYIQKIEGWTSVGYLESDVYVPYHTDVPTRFNVKWSIENVHPSVDKLFNSFTLPINENRNITLEELRNTKYLRIQYDVFDYPFYGWVDGAAPKSKRHIVVVWHPDYWRTYFEKCRYRGWVKLRAPTGNDPYHEIPSFYQKGCLEDIGIGYQGRGIAWVTITYIEGESAVLKLINIAGQNVVTDKLKDGLKEISSSIYNFIVPGASNAFERYLNRGENISATSPILPSIKNNYLVTRDFDAVRCLTFPISLNAGMQIYFTTSSIQKVGSFFLPRSNNFYGPTMFEVVNGALGRQLGIKENQLISCVVSPVAPFAVLIDQDHTGIDEDHPIVIYENGINIRIPGFNFNKHKIIKSMSSENRGFLKIEGYGIKDVGNINEGCPRLREALVKYYLGYYDIDPLEVTIDNIHYSVEISKMNLHNERGHLMIPLFAFLSLLYPQYRTYGRIDITDLKTEYGYKISVANNGLNPETRWNRVQRGNKYVYSVRINGENLTRNLLDYCDKKEISWLDIQHPIVRMRGTDDKVIGTAHYASLFITLSETRDWPEDRFAFNNGIYLSQFSAGAVYRVGFFNSSQDFGFVAGIYTRTTLFGKIKAELPREYYTDDYRHLYLIGPSGEILHKFRTGLKIKSYTYQMVAGPAPYIKIKFDVAQGNSAYPMASDAEIHVPLTSMTAFASYSNPWRYISDSASRVMHNQFENDRVAKARNLEQQNIDLERKKEQAGFGSLTSIGIAQALSTVMLPFQNAMKATASFLKSVRGGGGVLENIGNALPITGGVNRAFPGIAEWLDKAGETIAFPDVTTYYKDEDKIRLDTRYVNEDIIRDFNHKIGGFNLEERTSTLLSIGDMSWLTEYGGLRLVYLSIDDYSINRYHDTANVIGIEVNEHVPEFTEITTGPLKLEPCILQGEDVPQEAIAYIKSRLEAGVYVDKDL